MEVEAWMSMITIAKPKMPCVDECKDVMASLASLLEETNCTRDPSSILLHRVNLIAKRSMTLEVRTRM